MCSFYQSFVKQFCLGAVSSRVLLNSFVCVQFPPEFESGDGEGMDMQLPNKVYNKLKAHSLSESKRSTRHSEKKEHSTAVRSPWL